MVSRGIFVARDNSTGFTIQWGNTYQSNYDPITVWFLNSFSQIHSVCTGGNSPATKSRVSRNLTTSNMQLDHTSEVNIYWIAIGFS